MKLEDYIQGDRWGREARDLERRAMDDPFLRDALEGFDAVPGDHARAVERLRGRVAVRTRRRLSGVRIWAVAASLLLFLGVGGYLVVRMLPQQEPPIAVTQLPQESIPVTPPEIDEGPKEPAPEVPVRKAAPGRKIADKSIVLDKVTAAADTDTVVAEQLMEEVVVVGFAEQKRESLSGAITTVSPQEARRGAKSRARDKSSLASIATVYGVVRDSAGNALPGAVVVAKGKERRGVVTDTLGRYALNAAVGDKLRVSYLGYVPQQITVSQPVHDIALAEDRTALAEVTVAGFDRSERLRTTGAVKADSLRNARNGVAAEPEGGMRAYRKYLRKNLAHPQDCLCAKGSGSVTLRFDTDASGLPVNIRVVCSRCPACDREAMRLLREGPKWTPSALGCEIKVAF